MIISIPYVGTILFLQTLLHITNYRSSL